MNLLLRAAAAAALLLPLAVSPATAQNFRGAWTLYGGGIWFSKLNNDGAVDISNFEPSLIDSLFGVVVDGTVLTNFNFLDLTLEPGWIAGTQGEYWFGKGRFGLRANGSYTERKFKLKRDGAVFLDNLGLARGEQLNFGDVNTWLFDGDVMVRILRPGKTRTWAPYVTVGAGVAVYNPAGDGAVIVPAANSILGNATVDLLVDSLGLVDSVAIIATSGSNSKTKFALPVGLGTDILPGWKLGKVGFGVRAEVVDHIVFKSPARRLFGTGDYFGAVHNVRFTAGLLTTFGRLFKEEVVAVAPPPPAPPAPPAEEMITVCVVDPHTYKVGYVNAIFVPSRGDTLVSMNGQRTQFTTAYPETAPIYVANAGWYMSGEPLKIKVHDVESEWVTYGGARVIEPQDLIFMGTVRGTPIYVGEEDAREIRADLAAARAETNLEARLETLAQVREKFREIEIVYVPLETGCVFQPLRRVEEVRKVRG